MKFSASELLGSQPTAVNLLSKACMKVFDGDAEMRAISRQLDYLAYSSEIVKKGKDVAAAVISAIGDKSPGEADEEPQH